MSAVINLIDCSDIKQGDVLDVASDLLSIALLCRRYHEKFDPAEILNYLKEKVGPDGTILIRTFNWDYCHGVPFDFQKTPSQVGSLGTYALSRVDFKRTKHPIYSWCVWGKDKEYLCSLDHVKSFGEATPFDYFERVEAKMLVLGNTSVSCFTHLHHLEQQVGVPYRFEKEFSARYIDEKRVESLKTYSMYVRRLDPPFKVLEENQIKTFKKASLWKKDTLSDTDIQSLDLKKAYSLVRESLKRREYHKWITYI